MIMSKVLVTGGAGFIGSHTIVDLLEKGFDVVSVDNLSRADGSMYDGIKKITNKKFKTYRVDLRDRKKTLAVFEKEPGIKAVIHFAALKSVEESTKLPLTYFQNNLESQLNILECMRLFGISYFVYSSSCTVYGNAKEIPVTEDTPFEIAASSYGSSKQMGEEIIRHESLSNPFLKTAILRYFNPAGAHPSINIGEFSPGRPSYLVPAIAKFATGQIPSLMVHGTDYPTRDGSCVRDFIHVMDLAEAHSLALNFLLEGKNKLNTEIFNLGTGKGVTVLEMMNAYEKVMGKSLGFSTGPRRPGDVIAIFANKEKAEKLLGWNPKYSIEDIIKSGVEWEKKYLKTYPNL
jgi:UDP-glucose 4-epimerase